MEEDLVQVIKRGVYLLRWNKDSTNMVNIISDFEAAGIAERVIEEIKSSEDFSIIDERQKIY